MKEHGLIALDPPWWEQGGGKSKRGADRHYRLLKTHDMPQIIMQSGVWNPAADAHMYMWATNNHLIDGLWLMDALGFRYVTKLTWVKMSAEKNKLLDAMWGAEEHGWDASTIAAHITRMGLGQYFRGQDEVLLFGVKKGARGTERRTKVKNLGTVFYAPVAQHSQKPQVAYDLMVARSSAEEKLEMFARAPREGWDLWGEEAPEPTEGDTVAVCSPSSSTSSPAPPSEPPATPSTE